MNAPSIAVTTAPTSLSRPGGALPTLPAENTDFHLVLHKARSNNAPVSVADAATRGVADPSQQLRSGNSTLTDASRELGSIVTRNAPESTFAAIGLSSNAVVNQCQPSTTVVAHNRKTNATSIAAIKRGGAKAAGASTANPPLAALCSSSNPASDHLVNPAAKSPSAPVVPTDSVPRTPAISRDAFALAPPDSTSVRAASAITQASPLQPVQDIALPSSTPLPAAKSADIAASPHTSSAASVISSLPVANSSGTPSISGAPVAATTGVSLASLASAEAAAVAAATQGHFAARTREFQTPAPMPDSQTTAASPETERAAASQVPSEPAYSNPGQQISSLRSPLPLEPVSRGVSAQSYSTPGSSDNSASRQAGRSGRVRSESDSTRDHADAAPEKNAEAITLAEHSSISAAASGVSTHPATPSFPVQSATATAPASSLPQTMPDVSAVLGQRPQGSSPAAAPAQAQPNPIAEPPRAMGSAQLHVGEGGNELKISVQLPELGKVEVRAVTTHEVTTAHLTAFRHEGFQALAADRGGLEQALKSRDVILGSLDSHANGHSAGQQRQQGSHSPAQATSGNTPAAAGTSINSEADPPGFLPDHASISVRA